MKRVLPPLLSFALLFLSRSADAEPDANVEQARAYFETGSKEYEKGNYPNAIRAFEQAHALTQRPGLLFSLAQTYRRQYAVDSKPPNLRKAAEYYRLYLEKDLTGKRRGEAATALSEIDVILAHLPAETQGAAAPETTLPTQLAITTQAPFATISIDGGPPRAPEPVEVKPGKHHIVVRADGYFSEERDIPVLEGRLTALDVSLREMPARLFLNGRPGAEVAVDGRPVGTLPLRAPLSVDPGQRYITVTHNGYYAFAQELELRRGESRSVEAPLERTRQRYLSMALLGVGVVSAGVGIAFAIGGVHADDEAHKIDLQRLDQSIDEDTFGRYKNLVTQRNTDRTVATVFLNGAVGFGALAFLLYYFDTPTAPGPRLRSDRIPASPAPVKPALDISAVPLVGPGFLGGSVQATF